MNMQAILKQAQSLQKDMLKEQEKINATIFEGESSLVKVKVNGKKELLEVMPIYEGEVEFRQNYQGEIAGKPRYPSFRGICNRNQHHCLCSS